MGVAVVFMLTIMLATLTISLADAKPQNTLDITVLPEEVSGKIGHLKPEPQIYQHVIENVPFQKEEILFIDDLKSNVESAIKSGIDAVVYSDYNKLLQQIKNRDILV